MACARAKMTRFTLPHTLAFFLAWITSPSNDYTKIMAMMGWILPCLIWIICFVRGQSTDSTVACVVQNSTITFRLVPQGLRGWDMDFVIDNIFINLKNHSEMSGVHLCECGSNSWDPQNARQMPSLSFSSPFWPFGTWIVQVEAAQLQQAAISLVDAAIRNVRDTQKNWTWGKMRVERVDVLGLQLGIWGFVLSEVKHSQSRPTPLVGGECFRAQFSVMRAFWDGDVEERKAKGGFFIFKQGWLGWLPFAVFGLDWSWNTCFWRQKPWTWKRDCGASTWLSQNQ